MKFLRQIRFEIRNILRSRFLLIIGVLIIAAGIAVPVINLLSARRNPYDGGIKPVATYAARDYAALEGKYNSSIDKPGYDSSNSITVNGVTITSDNPFFWQLQSLTQEKKNIEANQSQFSKPAVVDVLQEMIDDELAYYLDFAQYIVDYTDYRNELAWSGTESLNDRFFFSHDDVAADVLKEAAGYRKSIDPSLFDSKYVNITAIERADGLAAAEENLSMLQSIIRNNDFPKYIALKIRLANDQIEDFEKNIAIQEKAIIDNPSQEDSLNQLIENYRKQIQLVRENTIPILEYRLAKNIIPGLNIWQNTALSDIENSRSQLAYMTIMTEEEFNRNRGGDKVYAEKEYYSSYYGNYGVSGSTYAEYVAMMQRQIDNLNKTMIIAQKSLDTNEPDMKYVTEGARFRTVRFLDYSIIVALFGVLIGGWLIASEFQQGTIRLLMIRPKSRTKILLAKFLAALLVCLAIDAAGSLLNLLTNGICFGFKDFTFPNYSLTGSIGFLAYYAPKFLICLISILFSFAMAFMISTLIKNIAVAIAIPIVVYVGSLITVTVLAYRTTMTWLIWTPVPYIQISSFFVPYSTIQSLIQNGVNLSLTYGAALLLALSTIFTLTSIMVFKKRDITN